MTSPLQTTQDSFDVSEYLRIPYRSCGRDRSGLDCYGLLVLFYREKLGIELPTFAGAYSDAAERREVAALLGDESLRSRWVSVIHPAPGDGVLLRVRGPDPTHVGIYLGDKRMLHVQRGSSVCVIRLDGNWKRRVLGYFRCTST